MSKQPIRIGYCLSLRGALASNGNAALTSETTKCCWMIRADISSAPLLPESMRDWMCGSEWHMNSLAASES